MKITQQPSPNFEPRRAPYDQSGPCCIVLHYTDMIPVEAALARLCDPDAKVSAHYLVTMAGQVYQLVDESQRAWHAGVSEWVLNGRHETDMNSASIGIELDNPGHTNGYVPFPAVQIEVLKKLCADICARHGIPRENIIGHSDIAPGRKQDPGELFPWDEFKR